MNTLAIEIDQHKGKQKFTEFVIKKSERQKKFLME